MIPKDQVCAHKQRLLNGPIIFEKLPRKQKSFLRGCHENVAASFQMF